MTKNCPAPTCCYPSISEVYDRYTPLTFNPDRGYVNIYSLQERRVFLCQSYQYSFAQRFFRRLCASLPL
jgi:hypothetical protein